MDRKKDMVISGGFNVYRATSRPCCLGYQPRWPTSPSSASRQRLWGETPVAFVVAAPGTAAESDELLAWANARLGKTQRLSALSFIDALPRCDRQRCSSASCARWGGPRQLIGPGSDPAARCGTRGAMRYEELGRHHALDDGGVGTHHGLGSPRVVGDEDGDAERGLVGVQRAPGHQHHALVDEGGRYSKCRPMIAASRSVGPSTGIVGRVERMQ